MTFDGTALSDYTPIVQGIQKNRYTNPKATWSTAEASPSGLAVVGDTAFMGALRGQRWWRIPLNGTEAGEITPLTTSNSDANGGRPAGADKILTSTITG